MIYLGIDGGGSKTAFLLTDEHGIEVQRAEAGPSNWLSSGEDVARRNIAAGIAQLKMSPDIVAGGFAGAGRQEGIRFYTDCIQTLLPHARVFVETDAFIAYAGALELRPGMLLIAGTGSIAIGRRGDASMIRVGGWGPAFSDEGSGFWMGREAIRHALRSSDCQTDEAFVLEICGSLGVDRIGDVAGRWQSGQLTVASVASLAALLFQRYPAEPSKRIIESAAEQLCALATAALGRVGIPDCPCAIAGSIGSQELMQELIRQRGGFQFQPAAHSPEHGAIIWARSQVRR